MRSVVASLFGFAVFGALFAAVYYDVDLVERQLDPPRFRMDPGEARADLIWDTGRGENITANITVLAGGPIDLYVVDVDQLSLVLNGTQFAFEAQAVGQNYLPGPSQRNITDTHNLTFYADGETRWYFLYVSGVAAPENFTTLEAEERAAYLTEISVSIRYVEREGKSLLLGYLFAAPSLLLVAVTLHLNWRDRKRPPPAAGGLRFPADAGL